MSLLFILAWRVKVNCFYSFIIANQDAVKWRIMFIPCGSVNFRYEIRFYHHLRSNLRQAKSQLGCLFPVSCFCGSAFLLIDRRKCTILFSQCRMKDCCHLSSRAFSFACVLCHYLLKEGFLTLTSTVFYQWAPVLKTQRCPTGGCLKLTCLRIPALHIKLEQNKLPVESSVFLPVECESSIHSCFRWGLMDQIRVSLVCQLSSTTNVAESRLIHRLIELELHDMCFQ